MQEISAELQFRPRGGLREEIIATILDARVLGAALFALLTPFTASSGSPLRCDPAGYPASLSWKHGAPIVYVSRPEDEHMRGFRPQNTPLVWRSGARKLEVHPLNMEFRFHADQSTAPASTLSFRFRSSEGRIYSPRLALPPKDYHEAPIRIIESGNWFQHVSIYGLELAPGDESQEAMPIAGHLEWKAWPDGGTVEFHAGVDNPPLWTSIEATWMEDDESTGVPLARIDGMTGSLAIEYTFGEGREVKWSRAQTSKDAVVSLEAKSGTVAFNTLARAWEITLPAQNWPEARGQTYPDSELDRISRLPFTIENVSNQEETFRLRFVHPNHPITGFVPMLLDKEGRQTGLPIQVSKNWHTRKDYPDLPNQGPWIHTSIALHLPPKSKRTLEYSIVHARWQGVPIASGHQLSLVGWGSNGFWHQMALGSWGETFCFQPGRVLRRSMITDIRPLFQPGMGKGNSYSWTSNVGGGDVGLIHDAEGRYLPWKDARVEYRAMGPNWSEVTIHETLANESASQATTIMLPRSDDMVRVFLRLEFKVTRPQRFSRFALFQFGTDYYASARAEQILCGEGNEADEIARSLSSTESEDPERNGQSIPWAGEAPWTLLQSEQVEATDRLGYGHRGLILRGFSGRLGGHPIDHLWLASHALADRAPNLSAELTVDPELKTFLPGDHVIALLEMVILPGDPDVYNGPNEAFAQSLRAASNFAEIMAAEAHHNQITLTTEKGRKIYSTLPVLSADEAREGFTLEGGQSLVTVKVTGFISPTKGSVFEWIDDKERPLGSSHPEEAEPQWTWNRGSKQWDLYLSLRAAQITTSRPRIFRFRSEELLDRDGH